MTTEERFRKLYSEQLTTQKMLLIMATMYAFDHDHSQWFRYLMFGLMILVIGTDIVLALLKGIRFLLNIRIRRVP